MLSWILVASVLGLGLLATLAPATYLRVMPDSLRKPASIRQTRLGGAAMLVIGSALVLRVSGLWQTPQRHPVGSTAAELLGAVCGAALIAAGVVFVVKDNQIAARSPNATATFVRWFGYFLLISGLVCIAFVVAIVTTPSR
jgi:hypothetical protein